MDAVVCPTCGTENEAEARFCEGCGGPLALACPSCGAAHPPGRRFCNRCGAALSDAPAPATAREVPSAELRTVSVLFVDLVGYTALSETRDAEDVRELLSSYFETARTIVGRYGGVIEKFIGDAVMAVWGAPVAHEHDAELAVRAGLELVDAVTAFGDEVGAPALRARAGVATGQVASRASPGEGLVVGDRVNTASRVQSTAQPGTVFVDEVTRQSSSAAIAYAEAGEHEVKGKAEPLRLWRALRVVAGARGNEREQGLEAPFAGREHELRLVKDLYHATTERGTVRLVAVSGAAGIGKSRLRQEFSYYTDGLVDTLLWHSGRCLSYGDGVAYWALAEMVRQRLDLPEDADSGEAARKLALALERWIPDAREREFLSPRLGALLGTGEADLSRAELFAGWRLFFERLAAQYPVVLIFEDLQWADDGLLDFIEHLLDWAGAPIFVLALARPELLGRRPTWAARPGVTTVALEPLGDEAVGALLDGLVSGLPAAVRERIVAQAEGVPLYALETVRALLDRGVLAAGDGGLVLRGEIGDLAIPASLSSLLTARLDGLAPDERTLVKDLAVMGGSFPRTTVAAVSGVDESRLDDLLDALVRKQVLTVRADPLSPERGQYAFAQTLLRAVAYDLLSKRERRPRHLAIAAHLRRVFGNDGEEVAEVIAAHLLDAYRAAAGDPDEDELRAAALAATRRAAQRASSIGAPEAAERILRTAVELAGDEAERAELIETAASAAYNAGHFDSALELYEAASGLHGAAGRSRDVARVEGGLSRALSHAGRNAEAIERLTAALDVLGTDTDDADVAILSTELGVALIFVGRHREAVVPLERGLVLAQALALPELTAYALHRTALLRTFQARVEEARSLFDGAVDFAERHGRTDDLLTAQLNRADLYQRFDLPGALDRALEAMAAARRLGHAAVESVSASNAMSVLARQGRWDEVERLHAELDPLGSSRPDVEYVRLALTEIAVLRGNLARARELLAALESWGRQDSSEARLMYAVISGLVGLIDPAEHDASLERLTAALHEAANAEGPAGEPSRMGWAQTIDAALGDGRLDLAAEIIGLYDDVAPGLIPPYIGAQRLRGAARLRAAQADHEDVEADLRAAVERFQALGYAYWAAAARTDLAEWLVERGRADEAAPLIAETEPVLVGLGAAPVLDRLRAAARAPV